MLLRWGTALVACRLVACVGAFPEAPQDFAEDASGRADAAGLAGRTPPMQPTPPPATAAPTLPGEACVPDICRECGPEGAHAPLADDRCGELNCSSLTTGRIETSGRTATCWITQYSTSLQGRCEAVGRCAVPEINFQNCGRQPEFAAPSIQDTACARFVNCERGNAQVMTYAEGTACSLDGVRGACDGRGACVAAPPPPPPPTEPPTAPPTQVDDGDARGRLFCGIDGFTYDGVSVRAAVCGEVGSGDMAACRFRVTLEFDWGRVSCAEICRLVGDFLPGRYACTAAWTGDGDGECGSDGRRAIRCDESAAGVLCDCRP